MEFISTRGFSDSVSFTEAVSQGLAPDGGLYLPLEFPDLTPFLGTWENLPYEQLCFEFFKLFATDMDPSILQDCIERVKNAQSVSSSYRNLSIASTTALWMNMNVRFPVWSLEKES